MPASAQQVGLGLSWVPSAPDRTLWTLGYSPAPLGPFEASLNGLLYDALGASRIGAGLDITLFRSGPGPWYAIAGVQGGFGLGQARSWSGWNAGVGFTVVRPGAFDLALEGRYLHRSDPEDAVLLGVRIGLRLGGRRDGGGTAPAAMPRPPLATAVPVAGSPLAQAVIQTALDLMGTPYVWGGSSANGFDCSGLIQHAFQVHGYRLPRRSADQAREGVSVAVDRAALRPGDVLTFAEPGAGVSHVGLYLGDGRFIHSASAGVQVSQLDSSDPAGGYWWRRWVGARRILPEHE